MSGADPYAVANADIVPPQILNVIHGILKSWDQSNTDYTYIDQFHPNGILHVAPLPTQGDAGMRKLHDDMINPERGPVVRLQHFLDRVFLDPSSQDGKTRAVFTGKLTNVLMNDAQVTTDFATELILSKNSEGVLKAEHARIYSDTSALMAAIVKMNEQKKSD